VRRRLRGGYELDDDRERIDLDAVHAFLTTSYWAEGRSRERQAELNAASQRLVGLYHGGLQVGFSRTLSDGQLAYLADVYVLPEHRGDGRGVELVRETVERGPFARCRWLLHTRDAHGLYERFGFERPGPRLMERPVAPVPE
jgi:GNAT superfamily N-acetyltransferase